MNTKEKNQLISELTDVFNKVKKLFADNNWKNGFPDHEKLWSRMVEIAVKLHKEVQPKHHEYMIKNRGCSPDSPEFYNHFDPVEDLLAFINDPNANDDPVDSTLGNEFYINIYTRRWGHDDKYKIKRIATGWFIGNIAINGNSDKSGFPTLYENFNQDSVNYPKSLPEYLEYLWDQAAEQGFSHAEVQHYLDLLSDWIKSCEKSSPQEIFKGYK